MIKIKDMGKFIQLNDIYGEKIWTAERKQRGSFFKEIFDRNPINDLELNRFVAEAEDLAKHLETSKIKNVSLLFESSLEYCRLCTSKLERKSSERPVVVYKRDGARKGIHKIKYCRKCLIAEHYAYYVKKYYRYLDVEQFKDAKYLFSSENTAFEKEMLREYKWELVIGKMSFQTKSNIYNQVNKHR